MLKTGMAAPKVPTQFPFATVNSNGKRTRDEANASMLDSLAYTNGPGLKRPCLEQPLQAPSFRDNAVGPRGISCDYERKADDIGDDDIEDENDDFDAKFNELHRATLRNEIDKVLKILEKKPELLDAQDKHGNTALHFAAACSHIALIDLLLQKGAKLQINNEDGFTPLYLALCNESLGAAQLLTHHMAGEPIESVWFTKDAVEQAVAAHRAAGGTNSFASVDKLASQLTGASIKGFLNNPMQLSKYSSHLMSWDKRFWGTTAEGWNHSSVVTMRIRSLLSILLSNERPPRSVGVSASQLREKLCQEIATQLETLRASNRVMVLGIHDSDELRRPFIAAEASHIAHRVLTSERDAEFNLPLGFPGHAFYLGLSRQRVGREAVVSFRLDNLGGGFPAGHRVDETGRVHPLMFHVPESHLATAQGRVAFNGLLTKLIDFDSHDGSPDRVYAALYEYIDGLKDICDPQVVSNARALAAVDPKKRQSVGNCSLKNHSAGMAARLGRPLFKWVKAQEIAITENRMCDYVFTHQGFAKKQREKDRDSVAEMIDELAYAKFRHGDASFEETVKRVEQNAQRFFAKKAHHNAARGLSIHSLKELIQLGSANLVRLVLEHGANLDKKDRNDNTLMHIAAQAGRPDVLMQLITMNQPVNSVNKHGRTPLHFAAMEGNSMSIGLLVEAGANMATTDEEGISAQSLCEKRAMEALLLLQSVGVLQMN